MFTGSKMFNKSNFGIIIQCQYEFITFSYYNLYLYNGYRAYGLWLFINPLVVSLSGFEIVRSALIG